MNVPGENIAYFFKSSDKHCEICLYTSTFYLLDKLRIYFKIFSPKKIFHTYWLRRRYKHNGYIHVTPVFFRMNTNFSFIGKIKPEGQQAPKCVPIKAVRVTGPSKLPDFLFYFLFPGRSNQGGFLNLFFGYYFRGLPKIVLFASMTLHHDFPLIFIF